jgi:6Fe-6S prismane cluster-containing protein
MNLKAMELLDAANTSTYGHPEPTEVSLRPKPGKAILVTGHDLKDLYNLLVQTEGKGINIYTHGEMLPCHAYPGSRSFRIWPAISARPGKTSKKNSLCSQGPSCLQPTAFSDQATFTRTMFHHRGWWAGPASKHVQNGDFGPVIERALASPGVYQGRG